MFSKVKNLFSTKFTKQKIILEKFNNFEQEVFWVLIAAGYNSKIYALLTLAFMVERAHPNLSFPRFSFLDLARHFIGQALNNARPISRRREKKKKLKIE